MGIERGWVLFLLPIALLLLLLWRGRSYLIFPSLDTVPQDIATRLFRGVFMAAPVLLLISLALLASGVRFPSKERVAYGYGADIVFLLDESGSMKDPFGEGQMSPYRVPDSGPSKFSAAKEVIAKFMERRRVGQDRYGLTVFGSSAVRVLPLSVDRELFLSCLEAQEPVLGGTVLYHPMASGLGELLRSKSRSRILLFVSDGDGPLQDEQYGFSEILKENGIRFYWLSMGTELLDDVPKFLASIGPLGKRIDVTDAAGLEKGFAEIHDAERSLIVYRSSSPWLTLRPVAYAALLLMALAWAAHSLLIYRR